MKEIKKYMSEDGVEFETEEECLKHEEKNAEKLKKKKEKEELVKQIKDDYEALVDLIDKYNKEYNGSFALRLSLPGITSPFNALFRL